MLFHSMPTRLSTRMVMGSVTTPTPMTTVMGGMTCRTLFASIRTSIPTPMGTEWATTRMPTTTVMGGLMKTS